MGGILNNRIKKWIKDFSSSTLDWDSYHINELQGDMISKNEWIEKAFEIFSLCVKSKSQSDTKITIALCFELNATNSRCPIPQKLSRRCFCNTSTYPEVYIFKNEEERSLRLANAVYLPKQSDLYNMPVYLVEKKEDVYYRWLFFMEYES